VAQVEIQIADPKKDYQILEVDMGGASYRLTLHQTAGPHTVRSGYYLDLRTVSGVDVALNRRVKLGDLLQDLRGLPNVPNVRLLVVDTSGQNAEPVRLDLGDRVRLVVDDEV